MTLTEFLLARIAEDEARIADRREIMERIWVERGSKPSSTINPGKFDRGLAECEAKRQRVEILAEMGCEDLEEPLLNSVVSSYAHSLLCREALPYADHPDYRQEWAL